MQIVNRYEIIREVGRGGMGIVYEAFDSHLARTVAIKTMSLDISHTPEEVGVYKERFLREARTAAALIHPNIIAVHDVIQEHDTINIVMEFVNGQTLEKALSEAMRWPWKWQMQILAEAAVALDYAHQRGVFHRDIKPANIMLDSSGHTKIADFGIAKLAGQTTLTISGMVLGSPQYMTPEQLKGESVTGRTDQFALGAVAYTLLSGRPPFHGDTISRVFYQIVNEPAARPSSLNPTLGPGVDEVLHKAMAKNPMQRFDNCMAFVEELAFLPGTDFQPDRVSTWNNLVAPWAAFQPKEVKAREHINAPLKAAKPEAVWAQAPVDVPPAVVRPQTVAARESFDVPPVVVKPEAVKAREYVDLLRASVKPKVVKVWQDVRMWGATLKPKAANDWQEVREWWAEIAPKAVKTWQNVHVRWAVVALVFFVLIGLIILQFPSGPESEKNKAQTNPIAAVQSPYSGTSSNPSLATFHAPAMRPPATATQPISESSQNKPLHYSQPPATPAGDAAEVEQLREVREQLNSLSTQAGPFKSRLDGLRRQQAGLPSDLANCAQRLDYYLGQTEKELNRRNAGAAKRNIYLATRDLLKLKDALGVVPAKVASLPETVKPAPISAGNGVSEHRKISGLDPEYPEAARRAHVEGNVILDITIDEKGNVSDIRLAKGHPLLVEAAEKAVRQWKYAPTLMNGEPIPVTATLTLYFKLKY